MKLNDNYVMNKVGEEYVLVPLENDDEDEFYGILRFNETTAFIIEQLKEDVTEEEIVDRMLEEYDVGREQVSADVKRILTKLLENGIIY